MSEPQSRLPIGAALVVCALGTAGGLFLWWDTGDPVPAPPTEPAVPQIVVRRGSAPSAEGGGRGTGLPAMSVRRSAATVWVPEIRVNLTPQPIRAGEFSATGSYRVTPLGQSDPLATQPSITSGRIEATASGLRVGGRSFAVGRLELALTGDGSLGFERHLYRGRLQIHRRPGNRILVVNVLPLDQYLASVVDSEMPAAFPDAAREAQAIIARTYALYHLAAHPRHPRFDVYATARSQKYLGREYRGSDGRRLAGESASSREIVARTAGHVCTEEGRLFVTYYSAVCGGRTVAGRDVFSTASPLLQSVPCEWCREASRYRWTTEVPLEEASAALRKHFRSGGGEFGTLTAVARGEGGAGTDVWRVSDGRGSHMIEATTVRSLLPGSFHSPRFEMRISPSGESLEIHGRGHGHGAGLCQWGARGQAAEGRTARQILQHYYPGVKIVQLVAE